MDLAFLSGLAEGMQTFTHVEAANPAAVALAEGTVAAASDGYCSLLVSGQILESVPDVPAHPVLAALPVTAALGVGGYCGVPVFLPDGSLYGTLCGLHGAVGVAPTDSQLEAMRTIAGLLGVRLHEEQQHATQRQALSAAFLPVLDGRQRTVALQAIVDLSSGAVVGYEALSRFSGPTARPRRPDDVFAEAHELGLGLRLEHEAARTALALVPQLPAHTYLSVNLSPQALLDRATLDLVAAAADGVAAGRVVLELTEHEHDADYRALITALTAVRERGVRLAVDDTGAGFASLQHVMRLRPDIVKLDMTFVRDVHLDPSRRAVARALIGFAGDIDATLVAEGIETPEELAELVRLGAPMGQGYHLGRPRPPAEIRGGAGRVVVPAGGVAGGEADRR